LLAHPSALSTLLCTDPEVKQLMRLAYGLASNGTGKGVDEWMSTPLRDLVEWAEVVDEALKEGLKGSKH
jgi:hypothetical protein